MTCGAALFLAAGSLASSPLPALPSRLHDSALYRLRGGETEQPKTGKLWVTSTFTRDHVRSPFTYTTLQSLALPETWYYVLPSVALCQRT